MTGEGSGVPLQGNPEAGTEQKCSEIVCKVTPLPDTPKAERNAVTASPYSLEERAWFSRASLANQVACADPSTKNLAALIRVTMEAQW